MVFGSDYPFNGYLGGDPLADELDIIEQSKLPCRDNANWQQAVGDGEDYELLFATDHAAIGSPGTWEVMGVPITVIGRMVKSDNQPTVKIKLVDGNIVDLNDQGWEHH